MKAIIIAGSRTFTDYELLKKTCVDILSKIQYQEVFPASDIVIVSGNAKGADQLGEQFAKEFGLRLKFFPAEWKDMSAPCIAGENTFGKYNKLAGMKRNQAMADYARENNGALIAFSQGTPGIKDMMKKASATGVGVYEIKC